MLEIDPKLDYATLEVLEKAANEFQYCVESLVGWAGISWGENGPPPVEIKGVRHLGRNLDEVYDSLRSACRELGIGTPQPETTTEGAPVTEVEVDGGGVT